MKSLGGVHLERKEIVTVICYHFLCLLQWRLLDDVGGLKEIEVLSSTVGAERTLYI